MYRVEKTNMATAFGQSNGHPGIVPTMETPSRATYIHVIGFLTIKCEPVFPFASPPRSDISGTLIMVQSAAIRRNIIESLEATVKRPLEVTGNTKIAVDLGLDSLAIMDFIMELEDKIDISIPLNRIAEIETIDDLVRTIEELKEDAE